ncbi:LD-carboxypeptidase [Sutterella sp.]|uniref:S66 peptidase family protein n=1 Tax=Sutterella sp. TaxID=1981025 RepID=UPI0026E0D1DC|nr:LD-carboxypeptidase [Sutterella sp.]MDO5531195.1 LD-carboxypeptidase [Sutterella sp.]
MNAGDDVFRGRRIVIPAPSHQVITRTGEIDHARRERGLRGLRSLGMIPVMMGGAFECMGRLAGDDERRAADFEQALLSREADLVMAFRGGYGMTRVLPLLDWERIGRATLPMVGYSDFTAFNLALLAKTGRPSWHGPMLMSFERLDPFMVKRFGVVFGADPGSLEWEGEAGLIGSGTAGRFTGTLWGGNLCLIESLVGTRWFPSDAVEGGILFLEDVDEAAYRVERMLLTLLEAGILEKQKAILIGSFTGADDAWRFEGDYTVASVLGTIRRRLPARIPMVTGFPFGHVPPQATLPVGVPAELELSGTHAALAFGGLR